MLMCQSNICDNFNVADERFSRPKNVFRLYLQRLCFKLFSIFFFFFYICLYGFKLDISSWVIAREGWGVILAMKGLLEIMEK